MDERSDRGEFYPGGNGRGGVPSGTSTDKVDRVNLGEIGDEYTLGVVKQKVNQIVRAIAPAVSTLIFTLTFAFTLSASAATAPLEDIPNTAPVVTNEEDAVAMAAVGALGAAVSNRVEAAEGSLQAEIAGATNAVVQAALRAAEAESNRVDATYAKRSEIPAQPDLSPYALKSELPQDYLTENDITNFATRAWIASQGYATGAGMTARLDAQDLAIDAATNWLWAAHLAEAARLNAASNALAQAHAQDMVALSNRLEQARSALDSAWRAGTNTVMQTVGSESNRLDSATNKVWQSALRADEALQSEIDSLRIVAADSNAVTRLVAADGSTWQDATGTVWQVQVATSLWTVVHSWTTNDVNWYGPWWWGAESAGEDYYEGPGWYISSSALTPMRMSEDPYASEIVVEWTYWGEEEHSVTTRCTRTVQWLTNAVDRVQYRGDVAAATNGVMAGVMGQVTEALGVFQEMGTVAFARQLISGEPGVASVTPSNVWQIARSATNYTDAVAARKQDALPYPTNAIPYAAIDGAPSGGGQEWREVTVWTEGEEPVHYVTNGMMHVIHGATAAFTVQSAGWPNGAAIYVDWDYGASPIVQLPSNLRLVGYGTWPTNNFQSVWWRSGTTIYVNILLEE